MARLQFPLAGPNPILHAVSQLEEAEAEVAGANHASAYRSADHCQCGSSWSCAARAWSSRQMRIQPG